MLSKSLKAIGCSVLLTLAVSYSSNSQAEINSIPLPNNTEIRMKLDDEYPMILTGFVEQDISDVMTFYRDAFGEPNKITEDIARYTYFFEHQGKQLRISFYQQQQWCEINIMLNE